MQRILKVRHASRCGVALIQAMVCVVALAAITSMAVDVGLFFAAKCELQRAADAAALAGVADLQAGGTALTATAQATLYATSNSINGQTLTATGIGVVCGAWKNQAFVPNATPTEAVCVTLRRCASSGNPLPLIFSRFFGLNAVDVSAVSLARWRRDPNDFRIVGIDHASLGSLGVSARINGRFVSNGAVSVGKPLGLLVGVQGDARSYGGNTDIGAPAWVSGTTHRLDDALTYDTVVVPGQSDDARIAAYLDTAGNFTVVASADIPAGTYVVHDLNLLAGVAVRLQGPVTFYVTGALNVAAAVNLLGDTNFDAKNFKVRVASGGQVHFLAPVMVPLNMDLYAPDSDISITVGIAAFKGRLIGRTLDISLPVAGSFTEDLTLGDVLPPAQTDGLVSVPST